MTIAATSIIVAGCVLAGGVPAHAGTPAAGQQSRQVQTALQTTITLPNGWRPDGIAIGSGPYAYFGSLGNGSIYRADLRTGQGAVLSQGPGTPAAGLKLDRRGRLFVAGGSAGSARVLNARTGEVLATYTLATGVSNINDVVLANGAAWFTNSSEAALYKLPFGADGALPEQPVRLPLTGDLVTGPGENANGIVPTPDGKGLLVVQTNTGRLFRVDPSTGATQAVDLGGETLTNGDGLLLRDCALYVVQNRLNTVSVLKINKAGTSARVARRITDPGFDTPTTAAAYHNRLYLPNARLTTRPTLTTPYTAVAIKP
ncbi:superoxide dismutase [Actinomadura sp. NBRC 104412]|uniref:superoxide dismutase n=1 Tax=Actinomadura sp. NBRC 104412 TaxID=3032203 RepID=UPI002554554B|nr:superoxide dismutase [Actinomadura sp. NBRC 104412]